jgi:LysR family transcriptional regulator, glycine cleavage system transcriptional activator
MRQLPSLTALRTFEAVGRLGSVKAAAQELNVTPAAVSHQVRLLEENLRTPIITRSNSGLGLTDAGRDLFLSLTQAFDALDDTARRIRATAEDSTIHVDSLPSFASCWLVPHLSSFYAEHSGVQIEVNTVGDLGYPSAVAKSAASVAIRVGTNGDQWPALIAEKLFHEEMFPVCAPSLLHGSSALKEPRDLAAHTLLIVSRRAEGWPEWLAAADAAGGRTANIDPEHGRKFDTIQLAFTAAIEGMGVVIGRRPLVDQYLKAGLLVEPFNLRVPSKLAYWLVSQPAAAEEPTLQAFRNWLRKELKSACEALPTHA